MAITKQMPHLPVTVVSPEPGTLYLHQVQEEGLREVVQGVGSCQVWKEAPLLGETRYTTDTQNGWHRELA